MAGIHMQKNAAGAKQARVRRHDDSREQGLDLRLLLQLLESQIRAEL